MPNEANSETDPSKEAIALMLGTAGHVDHGKTSLVRRLTGVETDRHKEEKERGVSIDFAVAPMNIPEVGRIGIIDVPGHEDFIQNMVSGAASIDVLILVVAADDAVMPQTIEHMRIVKLLGLKDVIVALTKIDLVDKELLSLVTDDIQEFLRDAGFGNTEIYPVSSETGEGIDHLKEKLAELVAKTPTISDKRAFRMYARHVFSLKGHGTVVTGVPVSGSLSKGESVVLLPEGKSISLRAIHTYGREASETKAHVSSAINVRDLSPEDISRGMALCAPDVYRSSSSIVARLLNNSDKEILHRKSEVRFLCGTTKAVARALLYNKDSLAPGESCYVRLAFQEPVVCAAGDKFIIRSLSPSKTIGGGEVLSVEPGRLRRASPFVLPRLKAAKEAVEKGDFFAAELHAGKNWILRADSLLWCSQGLEEFSRDALQALSGSEWLIRSRLPELTRYVSKALERYHRVNAYAQGMKPEQLCSVLSLSAQGMKKLLEELTKDEDLVLRHGCLAKRSFSPDISDREVVLREQILTRVQAAGAASLAKGPLLEELEMTPGEMKRVVKILVSENLVSVIGGNLMIRSALEDARKVLLELFKTKEVIELKEFRDKSGMSRNIGVALLEAFDSEGMTKRKDKGRVLIQKRLLEESA